MSKKHVLGIDAGLANTGCCVMGCVDGVWKVRAHDVFTTSKESKKRRIYAVDDRVRRIRQIVGFIDGMANKGFEIGMVVTELPHGSQSSNGAVALGISSGIVATFCYMADLPLRVVTPDDVKLAMTNSKKASKEMVMGSVHDSFGIGVCYPAKGKSKSAFAGKFEHVADSVAAVMAAKDDLVMKMMFDL